MKPGMKDTCGKDENGTGEQNFIPFRFQGQYEDEETGLYYNRFRYYSPEDGCYTQQDPIGLAGENPTIYGYVGNPMIQINVFGLNPFGSEREALRYAKELAGIPWSQQPVRQWIVTGDVTKYGNKNYVVSNNATSHGRYYEFVDAKGFKKVTVLHTSDPNIPTQAHAGKVPSGGNQYTYDFKKTENRYKAIKDARHGKDHHLMIRCKG